MGAYLRLSGSGREVGWGGRFFEAGSLLTFFAFRIGAYSRWGLIRGWALIRINTVIAIIIIIRELDSETRKTTSTRFSQY